MPTYVYQCKTCSKRFERIQKMTDPAVKTCPECGGAVRKVLFPPTITFKGPGFYVNDYKKPNPAGALPHEKPAPAAKPAETTPAAAPKPATATA